MYEAISSQSLREQGIIVPQIGAPTHVFEQFVGVLGGQLPNIDDGLLHVVASSLMARETILQVEGDTHAS